MSEIRSQSITTSIKKRGYEPKGDQVWTMGGGDGSEGKGKMRN